MYTHVSCTLMCDKIELGKLRALNIVIADVSVFEITCHVGNDARQSPFET